jgi:hypothetical protein
MSDEIIDVSICPEEECVDTTMPGFMDLAKNLMQDGGKIVKNAVQGNATIVSDEVRESRWSTCQACPFLSENRCTKCGCFMKVKVAFVTSQCPEGKW